MKISSHYIIATATAAFVISNSHALPSARCNPNNNSACPSDKVAYECDTGDQKCCLWTGIPPSASQNQIDQLMADVNLNGVMCYRSDYVPPTTIATTVAPTTTEEAAIAPPPTSGACLTKDECTAAANALGVGSVVEGVYPSKGCFSKGGRVFFSEGSIEDMSTTELPGMQERIICDGSGTNKIASASTLPSNEDLIVKNVDQLSSSARMLLSLGSTVFFMVAPALFVL